MNRVAAVYERLDNYYVSGYDRTKDGFWISSHDWALPGTAKPAELAALVLHALNQSKQGIPRPPREAKLDAELLKLSGTKSYRAFAKGARSVDVFDDDGKVTITPTHNGGSRTGFTEITEFAQVVSLDLDDLGSAIFSALTKCT